MYACTAVGGAVPRRCGELSTSLVDIASYLRRGLCFLVLSEALASSADVTSEPELFFYRWRVGLGARVRRASRAFCKQVRTSAFSPRASTQALFMWPNCKLPSEANQYASFLVYLCPRVSSTSRPPPSRRALCQIQPFLTGHQASSADSVLLSHRPSAAVPRAPPNRCPGRPLRSCRMKAPCSSRHGSVSYFRPCLRSGLLSLVPRGVRLEKALAASVGCNSAAAFCSK